MKIQHIMRATNSLTLAIASGLLAQAAIAQSDSKSDNSITVGIGYSNENSYRFGEYSGIVDRGGFAIGGFNFSGGDSTEKYWSVEGRNLGLDTGGFAANYEKEGRFEFFLKGDQLPHYRIGDGRTPYRGAGSTWQTLPANWVGAASTNGLTTLTDSLVPARTDTKRQRLTSGFSWQFNKQMSLDTEYRHETKQGAETLGAIFGSTGGNPRSALLARPIDFETDEVEIGVSFNSGRSQYSVSYNAMLFSNKDKSLSWQNAFNNPQWASGANFSDGAYGRMALEPDTTSSQFTLSGGHSFEDGGRISGSLITTRLQQDDSFLPFSSVITAAVPLPRLDLGARVDSTVANLNYSRQLSRRMLLRLRYKITDRDNKTPVELYQRVPGDSASQGELLSANARRNRVYDQQSTRVNADLSYRLGGGNRLAFGVEREQKDRNAVDVATTTENTGFVKLNFAPSTLASSWIKFSRSQRDASRYDSTVPFLAGHNPDFLATLVGNDLFENDPLLRRYHLTDRDRDEFSAAVNFYPSDKVGLSLLAKNSNDDYPDAITGLQESTRRNIAVDLSYTPQTSWQASVYYNFDNYDNRQNGFARRGGGAPTPFFPAAVRDPGNNWRMDSEDNVHTVGAGVDWVLLDGRLQLQLDGSYADAITTTTPFSTGQPWANFPDVATLIKNVSLVADYKITDSRELKLTWFFEDYQSSDWAFDEVGVDTLSNVLLLGNQSPYYAGNLLMLSYVMHFDR